jgi:hypothetical protein
MQSEICRKGVEFAVGDDHATVSELATREAAQPLHSVQREKCVAANTVAVYGEGIPAPDIPGGAEFKEPEFPLADAALIVEDLLLQARTMAESEAPSETIKAILDHVAALREGGR